LHHSATTLEKSMSQTSNSLTTPADASAGYDRTDAKGRSIYIGLAVSVVVIVLTIIFLDELFVMTTEDIRHEQYANATNPVLSDTRARSEHNLSTYEWADSTNDIVRIPIERAMMLMVEEAAQEQLEDGQ
jgi:hypothetical protein